MSRYGYRKDRPVFRLAAIAAGVVLIAVVGVVVTRRNILTQSASCSADSRLTEVRGIIGSEKATLFKDDRVVARFACLELSVRVDERASLEMITTLQRSDHSGYDFVFPASTPTAEKIMKKLGIIDHITPFTSPMAVATFNPIVQILSHPQTMIVRQEPDGSQILDIKALIDAARKGLRWDQVPGNTVHSVHNAVLLRTTNPQESNSGLMFLAIASHVANNGAVVMTAEQLRQVMPDLCLLMSAQGWKPETSRTLFDQYITGGMGQVPLGLIYEAQYLQSKGGHGPKLAENATLLYPKPTIYSRHALISMDEKGRRVGQVLRDDPELRRLAVEYGFRVEGQTGSELSQPTDVIESPSDEILQKMLDALDPNSPNGQCPK